jgi:hypothetical protein
VRIARRGVESSIRLGRHRWKAERTIAWLFGCRRLRVRYDRSSERFFAFALLACARLCYNRCVSAGDAARSPGILGSRMPHEALFTAKPILDPSVPFV